MALGQPEWDNNDYQRDFVWLGVRRDRCMRNDELQKLLARFPASAPVEVLNSGVAVGVERVEVILPATLAVDAAKNLSWSELVADAIKVRIVPVTPMATLEARDWAAAEEKRDPMSGQKL